MTISRSIAYDGSVGESEHAALMQTVGSQNYGVCGASDWSVSIDGGSTRGVRVAAGWGYGFGILDYNDSDVLLSADAQATGSRFDTVVATRDAANNRTTFAILRGGSSATVASLRRQAGGISDQPLALIEVTSATRITSIINLRSYQEKVTTVESVQALPFPWPGSVAHVGPLSSVVRDEYRVRMANGSLSWAKVDPLGASLGSISGTYAGLSPENSTSPRRVWGINGETLATLSIPDFGRPVEVEARFTAEIGSSRPGGGLRWDTYMHIDGPNGVQMGSLVPQSYDMSFHDLHPLPVRLSAGPHTLYVIARGIIADGGNYGYGITTPYNRYFQAVVKAA